MSEASPVHADASAGQLMLRLTDQLSALVQDEIALAKLEIAQKGKRLAVGGALLGAAGFLAVYGLAALLVGAGLALALVVDGWLAALIVGGAIMLVVGVLALAGKTNLSRGGVPVPAEAIAGLRRDVAVVKKRGLT